MKKAANSSISLRNIHISDAFWRKYIRLVKDVIIPYQWDILNDNLEGVETSHCIENFRIAAGEKQGEYYGAVFQDTDVAKWLEAVGFVLNFERDEKLEKLVETVENMDDYDVIFLGYPNWWYSCPMALISFLEEQDFSGKQVYLFCSHGTGGLANSVEDITEVIPDADLSDNVFDVYEEDASSSRDEVESWLQELGY